MSTRRSILAPVRRAGGDWSPLAFRPGNDPNRHIQVCAPVVFEDDSQLRKRLRNLKTQLLGGLGASNEEKFTVMGACPQAMLERADGGELTVGVREQRSWELAYALALLAQLERGRWDEGTKVWATGEITEEGRVQASPLELKEKLDYIARQPGAHLVYAPLPEGFRWPSNPSLRIRPVDDVEALAAWFWKGPEPKLDALTQRLKAVASIHASEKHGVYVPLAVKVEAEEIDAPGLGRRTSRLEAAGSGAYSSEDGEDSSANALLEEATELGELEDIVEALDEPRLRHCVLVGGGGEGKTWALERLRFTAAVRACDDPRGVAPLYADFEDWDAGHSLTQYLETVRESLPLSSHQPRPLLYLLDNLHRVDPDRLHEVEAWLDDEGDKQVILACRTGYGARDALSIPALILQPLDRERQLRFLDRLEPDRAKSVRELLERIDRWEEATKRPRRQRVDRLLRNPFLMHLFVETAGRQRAGDFADGSAGAETAGAEDEHGIHESLENFQQVGEIYDLLRVFARRLHGRHARGARGPERRLEVFEVELGRAAYEMLRQRLRYLDELLDQELEGEGAAVSTIVAQLAVDCGFVRRAPTGELRFTHQLWETSFALRYLVAHPQKATVLVQAPRFRRGLRLAGPHDDLLLSLLSSAEFGDDVFAHFVAKDPFLARLSLQVRYENRFGREEPRPERIEELVGAEARQELLSGLTSYMIDHGDRVRELMAEHLGWLGSEAVHELEHLIHDDRAGLDVQIAAAQALRLVDTDDSFEALFKATTHRETKVRKRVRMLLKQLYVGEREDVKRVLRERLPAIARYYKGVPQELIHCWRTIDPDLVRCVVEVLDLKLEDPLLAAADPPDSEEEHAGAPAGAAADDAADDDDAADEDARDVAQREEGGRTAWGRNWITQWEELPGDEQLEAQGRRWLRATSPEHPSWRPVWSALWQEYGGEGDAELVEFGHTWLRRHPVSRASWPIVWVELRGHPEHHGDEDWFWSAGRSWLRDAELFNPLWCYVWVPLLESSSTFGWLHELGFDWLERFGLHHKAGSVVWTALWENPGLDEDRRGRLRKQGEAWLKTVEGSDRGWGYVWKALWTESHPRRAEAEDAADRVELLHRHGIRLLDDACGHEHGAWWHVWPLLARHAADDEHLLDLGRRWLAARPPSNHVWFRVLRALLRALPGDPKASRIVLDWLRALRIDEIAWARLWCQLMDLGEKGRLVELGSEARTLGEWGKAWLAHVDRDHALQGELCSRLLSAFPDDDDLVVHYRDWLAVASFEHGGWARVWSAFHTYCRRDDALFSHTRKRLSELDDDSRAWGHVASALLRSHGRDRPLVDVVVAWFRRSRGDHPSWPYVLAALHRRDIDRNGLAPMARARFDALPRAHPQWPVVFGAMIEAFRRDPDLRAIGREWLERTRFHRRNWSWAWRYLAKDYARHAPDELVALGFRALAQAPAYSILWPDILPELLRNRPTDEKLQADALRWLQSPEVDRSRLGWRFVWEALEENMGYDEVLEEQGMQRLEMSLESELGNQDGWPFLWKRIHAWASTETTNPALHGRLLRAGLDWIRRAPMDVAGWVLVWKPLVDRGPETLRRELLERGRPWLDNSAYHERASWPQAWLVYYRYAKRERPQLVALASTWLSTHDSAQLAEKRSHLLTEACKMWCRTFKTAPSPGLVRWGHAALGQGRLAPKLAQRMQRLLDRRSQAAG